ncbi:MAG: hypothetical protein ACYDH3_00910 [Candidatus Aminicenantales bacterium]
MNRKEFFKTAGKIGVGACLCGAAGGLGSALAGMQAQTQPGEKTTERAVERLEFADSWVKRFFDVMDRTLDEETRKKLMMVNGETCFQDWIRETKQEIRPVEFEAWAGRAAAANHGEGLKIEGNVISYQYSGSAETGGARSPTVYASVRWPNPSPPGCHPPFAIAPSATLKNRSSFGSTGKSTSNSSIPSSWAESAVSSSSPSFEKGRMELRRKRFPRKRPPVFSF